MASVWQKLPFEVLTCIFEHSIDGSRYIQFTRKDLQNYQLVCKAWSKAAQSLLYRHISYQEGNAKRERQKFDQFIHTIQVLAPHVGPFIKTIIVCDCFNQLTAPLEALDAIFNACPNLEAFYCNGTIKNIAWPYLLNLPDERLSKIQSIVQGKDSCYSTSPLYPLLALKLKKSLQQLHYVDIVRNPAENSKHLLDNLSQFVSLQELSLLHCQPDSYDQIFKAIDACSPTVSKLSIYQYLALSPEEPTGTNQMANPNSSIKDIYIHHGIMDSIVCFASKFKNLKKLKIDQLEYTGQMGSFWIRGLTDLCCSLPEYKLSFNISSEADIKNYCIDLAKRSSSKDTCLIMDYSGAPEDPLAFGDLDGIHPGELR